MVFPKASTLRASPRKITLPPPRDIRVQFPCAATMAAAIATSATTTETTPSLPPPPADLESQVIHIRVE